MILEVVENKQMEQTKKCLFDLDILIPTAKQPERKNNLICQIHMALNSGINSRVTVAMLGEYPGLLDHFTPFELSRIRVINNVPQGTPSISIEYALENMEWADWLYIPADDDCVLPWGYKHLWDARKDVSMVLGQVLCVSREHHYDFTAYKVGRQIEPSFISGACAMFNMRSMEKLEKPWMSNDPISDFYLIKKMSERFPYKMIPNVIAILSLCELEHLHPTFSNHYKNLYGHLL